MPAAYPLPEITCPWCERQWSGRDTFTSTGLHLPQHQCRNPDCRKYFTVAYRVRVAWVRQEAGEPQLRVAAAVVGVVRSFGPSRVHLLDTLTSLQHVAGADVTQREIRIAMATASALSGSPA
ncbi:MAG: hypothetical protein AB1941_09995 [Gemmatimonadota bacterium]